MTSSSKDVTKANTAPDATPGAMIGSVTRLHDSKGNEFLVQAMKPRFIRLTAEFYVRGGIYTTVVAEHRKAGWKPAAAIALPADAQ